MGGKAAQTTLGVGTFGELSASGWIGPRRAKGNPAILLRTAGLTLERATVNFRAEWYRRMSQIGSRPEHYQDLKFEDGRIYLE